MTPVLRNFIDEHYSQVKDFANANQFSPHQISLSKQLQKILPLNLRERFTVARANPQESARFIAGIVKKHLPFEQEMKPICREVIPYYKVNNLPTNTPYCHSIDRLFLANMIANGTLHVGQKYLFDGQLKTVTEADKNPN